MRFLLTILASSISLLLIHSCSSNPRVNTNTVKFDNGSTLTYLTDVENYYKNEFPIISWDDAISIATNKKILDVPVFQQKTQGLPDSDGTVAWCGQTSLQMVLSYYGLDISQFEINEANSLSGNPTIYFEDMVSVIEKSTNNKFQAHAVRFWSPNNYRAWIENQININKPVIATFKMNPTKTPQWLIDHFSVISGYDENGIYILTTWSGKQARVYRTWEQLLSKKMNGLSFIGSLRLVPYLFIAFDISE